jgi:hypothetical protein
MEVTSSSFIVVSIVNPTNSNATIIANNPNLGNPSIPKNWNQFQSKNKQNFLFNNIINLLSYKDHNYAIMANKKA